MMETKQIISWLLDKADRVADQSAGRIMKQAAKRLEELDQEQKWIPVSKRLPEPWKWVLCYCRAGIIEALRYDDLMDDWDTPHPSRCYMKGFVTHWMPLPEPPKEVDHES